MINVKREQELYDIESGGAQQLDVVKMIMFLWRKRAIIFSLASLSAALAVAISFSMPVVFRSEVLLSPVDVSSNGNGFRAGLGGLGGLASIAGMSIGSAGDLEENLAVLQSRSFLWAFLQERGRLQILFQDKWDEDNQQWLGEKEDSEPTLLSSYRKLSGLIKVDSDQKSGLVTVAVEWGEPEVAAAWCNQLIERLNSFLRRQAVERSKNNLKYLYEELKTSQVTEMKQALYELISQEQKNAMLANTQTEFAFSVIDPAVVPEQRIKPNRKTIVVLGIMFGIIFGIVFSLIVDGVNAVRLRGV